MPELTVMVDLGGRQVEMRKPTDGSLVVLARVARGLPRTKIENADEIPTEERDRMVRNLGTIGKVVEGMIVNDADADWLDDAMISGEVTAIDVFAAIGTVAEKINGSGTAKKAAAPVRRRR